MQALGIAGCAWHRVDPGSALEFALHADDPALRARALLAAGELGRTDLQGEVRDALRAAADDPARFSAAWTAALWREPEAARALASLAERGGPFAEQAAAMAARSMPQSAARTWLLGLARSGDGLRPALAGAAALGDAGLVPWLLEQMAAPAAARLAGAAMARITGADFVKDRLAGRAPAGFVAGPTRRPRRRRRRDGPGRELPLA